MEPLVEVNGVKEADVAVRCGASFIGVNNRNLKTFKVDPKTTTKVAQHLKDLNLKQEITLAALSGIKTRDEVEEYLSVGCKACLIGESLMRSPDPIKLCQSFAQRRPLVKICGITNSEDALHAVETGADMIGLIFAQSKRRVDASQAKRIIEAVRGKFPKCEKFEIPDVRGWFSSREQYITSYLLRNRPLIVGVFLDQEIKFINDIVAKIGLDIVQLHGDESFEYCKEINAPIIKTIHIEKEPTKESLAPKIRTGIYDWILLDTRVGDKKGGTGMTFDWKLAAELVEDYPIMIAGGLTTQNVGDAVDMVTGLLGVDVSSGVEAKPGQKDHEKVKNFIINAKTVG